MKDNAIAMLSFAPSQIGLGRNSRMSRQITPEKTPRILYSRVMKVFASSPDEACDFNDTLILDALTFYPQIEVARKRESDGRHEK